MPTLAGHGGSAVQGTRANPGRARPFIRSFPVFEIRAPCGAASGGRARGETMLVTRRGSGEEKPGRLAAPTGFASPLPVDECGGTATGPETKRQGGRKGLGKPSSSRLWRRNSDRRRPGFPLTDGFGVQRGQFKSGAVPVHAASGQPP